MEVQARRCATERGVRVPLTSPKPYLTAVKLRVRTRRTAMDVLPDVIVVFVLRMGGSQAMLNIALCGVCISAAIAS